MSNKFLFLLILFISLTIAFVFLVGIIDQDFFSFYYVGRGVAHGGNMYRDFADNKGPALYILFALLETIFKNHYKLAIIFTSGFLDTFTVFFFFKILEHLYKFTFKKSFIYFFIIFSAVLFYKSFSIGSFMGGVYSETLGAVFLSSALFASLKDKKMLSGILLTLAIFTRLSFIFFLPVFIALILIQKQKIFKSISFSLGFIVTSILITLPFLLDGTIHELIYNMITFNKNYGQATRPSQLYSLIFTSISETRIIFTFIYISIFVLLIMFLSKKKIKYIILVIYLCSMLASNPGGIFYFHHFTQFMLISFIVAAYLIKYFPKRIYLFAIYSVVFLTLLSYGIYVYAGILSNQNARFPFIKELAQKKYLQVIPYYSEYYFTFNKFSPDRYYQSFFLLNFYNTNSAYDINRHRLLDKTKLRQTLFLAIVNSETDKNFKDEYLQKFGAQFHLIRKNTYKNGKSIIEVYESGI